MSSFKIGDRIQIGTDLCTIKYSGKIDKWPNSIAYGVEWDNSSRGKHSGDYNGRQVFQTLVEGAGSFMKESTLLKKLNANKTFWEALEEVYGTTSDPISVNMEDITFNNKRVESLGFQKLDNMNKDYTKLKVISLNNKNIEKANGNHDTENITLNVRYLDLGFNCLANFSELTTIAQYCPYLEELNLSGNRFTLIKNGDLNIHPITQVKRLYITSCNISRDFLNIISDVFPNLEFLDLSLNRLTDKDLIGLTLPGTLKELILSENILKTIPTHIFLPEIQYLDLSNNMIENVFSSTNGLKNILSLNITSNKISDWTLLDSINSIFPFLNTIKINRNPIVGNLEEQNQDEDTPYYPLIAKLEKIQHIDGLSVSQELRETAESYFVFNMDRSGYTVDENLERWKYLESRYGKKSDTTVKVNSNTFLTESILQLNINNVKGYKHFKVYVLDTWTVRALKGKIASLTTSNILSLKLYIANVDERQYLDKEFSRIKDYYITSGYDIYYEIS